MTMLKELRKLEEEGKVTLKANTQDSLFIANYTPVVQYERSWDELLMQCRGLIVSECGEVVARPFRKFFNIEEHQPEELPDEPFEVYDKLDGSLGIMYFEEGNPAIATRGSFMSDQAIKASAWLHTKYKAYLPSFQEHLTYLFEIIYPENRIVVNYGKEEKLVLLAIIDTATGEDLPIEEFDFPHKVKKYDGVKEISDIRKFENDLKEGFVVKYQSGFRVKVKFSEYVRLHRIITQVSNKTVWEYLKEGKPFDDLLDRVPDEFYQWVRATKEKLEQEFSEIEEEAIDTYRDDFPSKKAFALWAQEQEYSHLLFCLANGKDMAPAIWRMIKPKYEKPFTEEVQ
ncbi:RNA ligase [Chondrinema litorale]|uniref:RNA ligase n=1 Tax=Chondrinema litorale TaxID=2994555 RepID=UPI0025431ED7|nr:RNA ligase [Chondrinema litorale]UZR95207.1 hypothetical protein OQ292_05165 [Chondrinema litorale]